MTEAELNKQYKLIGEHIANRRLNPAFRQLEDFIKKTGQPLFLDEWRNLDQTYHYMLQYTVEGIRDPERQRVYRSLIVSAFELADKVYDAARYRISSSLEYEKKRSFSPEFSLDNLLQELENAELEDGLDALLSDAEVKRDTEGRGKKQQQEKIVSLFYYLWFCNTLGPGEKVFLKAFFQSNAISVPYKSLITAALMMSLLRFFDEEKFAVLFDAYENDSAEVSQRALVALLVAFYKFDQRMPFYPALEGRVKLLSENPVFIRQLETVIIQFIRSKETEKIQKKIADEIIPEMIKISPNLKDKINLDSLMDDSLGEDKNPEWEKIFEDAPGLVNKMEEFSEMQMEGADVFMSSFSMLKMFPFFQDLSNWFMPFFAANPDINEAIDKTDEINARFIKAIEKAPILCNSDKYSFCFSLQSLPSENREFMVQGMEGEMDQFNELQHDEALTDPGKKEGFVSNQFIQDLYRFFKLHPRKSGFEDIFTWRFDFHNTNVLSHIVLENSHMLRNVAEFYFSKNYYDEAAEIFEFLLSNEKDGELYQKLGYCYQQMKNFEKALDVYKKAELFDLNRKWNLNKIALCYRNLKQTQKALEYYREAEKLDEDNLNIQLNIGHCLLELGQYEAALKSYFKVEYLAPGNKKVWRPIGWCSFVVGKKTQAENYFRKLVDDGPNKHDLMNMGHVQWSLGNRKEALAFYKRSITQADFTEQEFFEVFEEDQHHLIEQGIDADDVPIMLDQLRYFVEE